MMKIMQWTGSFATLVGFGSAGIAQEIIGTPMPLWFAISLVTMGIIGFIIVGHKASAAISKASPDNGTVSE